MNRFYKYIFTLIAFYSFHGQLFSMDKLWILASNKHFYCLKCETEDPFSTHSIKRHCINEHPQEFINELPHLQCPDCSKIFPYESHLNKHRNSKSSCQDKVPSKALWHKDKNENYFCKVNDCKDKKRSFSKDSLSVHLIKNHPDTFLKYYPGLQCPDCKKLFPKKNKLHRHRNAKISCTALELWNIDTQKNFYCMLCDNDNTPLTSTLMRRHALEHHRSEYLRKFPHLQCKGCSKLFTEKSNLDKHKPHCSIKNKLINNTQAGTAQKDKKHKKRKQAKISQSAHVKRARKNNAQQASFFEEILNLPTMPSYYQSFSSSLSESDINDWIANLPK